MVSTVHAALDPRNQKRPARWERAVSARATPGRARRCSRSVGARVSKPYWNR